VHQHVVWSRIDADSMTAIPDSHNYRTHELVARDIEQAYGLKAVPSTLTRDKEKTPRPERCPDDWESFRAADSKIDPKVMKAELTALWNRADSGQAFAAALAERGYVLAKGDRRDFCIVDAAGDEHSLARRIDGVKAAAIRLRMADIDREALPSVSEGRALARQRQEQPADGSASPFEAILAETVRDARAAVMQKEPDERFTRWHAWWETMRQHVAGLNRQAQERFGHYFSRGGPDELDPEPVERGPER
jgi:hypothetical protein